VSPAEALEFGRRSQRRARLVRSAAGRTGALDAWSQEQCRALRLFSRPQGLLKTKKDCGVTGPACEQQITAGSDRPAGRQLQRPEPQRIELRKRGRPGRQGSFAAWNRAAAHHEPVAAVGPSARLPAAPTARAVSAAACVWPSRWARGSAWDPGVASPDPRPARRRAPDPSAPLCAAPAGVRRAPLPPPAGAGSRAFVERGSVGAVPRVV
jgi:hypothetical protein